MKDNKFVKYLRLGLLSLFLILITVQAYLHQVKGGGEAASIHALCPYGSLESIYSLLGSGTFIQKIFSGTLILLALTILLAIIFRRSFCGLICPFGALQELFGTIGKKIFGRKFIVPTKIDKPLRYLKYFVLIVTIYYAWKTSGLWMAPYDPWSAFGHISEGISSLIEGSLIGFILLITTLIGSMLYDRFFCKYLCPMGAVYGIISKVSMHKIVRNEDKCINCGICSKNCPVNIDVAHNKQITSAECISCNICVLSCPKSGALEIKQGKKTIRPIVVMVLVMAIFFGGVLISKAIGVFTVLPQPITAGKTISVEQIRGYMTLKEISSSMKIDIKELYTKLKIPNNVPENTKLKEVKNFLPGFTDEKAKEILKK